MTETVYKYVLDIKDSQPVTMPSGAEVLSVGMQDSQICLWARVDPDQPPMPYRILLRGTGHPFTGDEGRFIGTVMLRSGSLVFHAFEGWINVL